MSQELGHDHGVLFRTVGGRGQVWLSRPGPNDALQVLSTPASARAVEERRRRASNGTCVVLKKDWPNHHMETMTCASGTTYCLEDWVNDTMLTMDCRTSANTRIVVNASTFAPLAAVTLNVMASADLEVEVVFGPDDHYIQSEVADGGQYGIVRHRNVMVQLDSVPRLRLTSALGQLQLHGQYAVPELVVNAPSTTTVAGSGELGCHALLLNCEECEVPPALFASTHAYVLAGQATTATAFDLGASNVSLRDGCVLPGRSLPAPAAFSNWFAAQAATFGVTLPNISLGCHLYLNATWALTLFDAASYVVHDVGPRTRELHLPAATSVDIFDAEVWNGTTTLEPSLVRVPGDRYNISVGATAVRVHAALENVHSTDRRSAAGTAVARWLLTNNQTSMGAPAIGWNLTACQAMLWPAASRAAVQVWLEAAGTADVAYTAVGLHNVTTATVQLAGVIITLNNGTDTPQVVDKVTGGRHALEVQRAPVSAPRPSVVWSPVEPSDAFVLVSHGPVVLDHRPKFWPATETVTLAQTQDFCLSAPLCEKAAWIRASIDGHDMCHTATAEHACDHEAVVVLRNVAVGLHLGCAGSDTQVNLSSIPGSGHVSFPDVQQAKRLADVLWGLAWVPVVAGLGAAERAAAGAAVGGGGGGPLWATWRIVFERGNLHVCLCALGGRLRRLRQPSRRGHRHH